MKECPFALEDAGEPVKVNVLYAVCVSPQGTSVNRTRDWEA